jgi:hypothetical protein
MLEHPEPVPTGLITALLARSQVRGVAVSERIGPSPRQMRELTEGRGLFSPFKINRVAELTGVPEERIRAAQRLITEIGRAVRLRTGQRRTHPRLGEVTILSTGTEISVRTADGRVLDGVQTVSFAGPEVLDLFGLTPEGTEPAPTSVTQGKTIPEGPIMETEPAMNAEATPGNEPTKIQEMTEKAMTCDTNLTPPEPAIEPEPAAPEIRPIRGERTLPRAPAELVERLVSGSGLSRNALSRAIGRDPAFLSGVLCRGRRMPPELLAPLALACGADPERVLAEAGLAGAGPAEMTAGAQDTAETHAAVQTPDPVPTMALERTGSEPEGVNALPLLVPEPPLPAPDAEEGARDRPGTRAVLEVIVNGVLRVRIPSGFDMEAAARLIRALTGRKSAPKGA